MTRSEKQSDKSSKKKKKDGSMVVACPLDMILVLQKDKAGKYLVANSVADFHLLWNLRSGLLKTRFSAADSSPAGARPGEFHATVQNLIADMTDSNHVEYVPMTWQNANCGIDFANFGPGVHSFYPEYDGEVQTLTFQIWRPGSVKWRRGGRGGVSSGRTTARSHDSPLASGRGFPTGGGGKPAVDGDATPGSTPGRLTPGRTTPGRIMTPGRHTPGRTPRQTGMSEQMSWYLHIVFHWRGLLPAGNNGVGTIMGGSRGGSEQEAALAFLRRSRCGIFLGKLGGIFVSRLRETRR